MPARTVWLFSQPIVSQARIRREPFFLYLAHDAPHTPMMGKEELVAHYPWDGTPHSRHILEVRPRSKPGSAVMDLRQVKLTLPEG